MQVELDSIHQALKAVDSYTSGNGTQTIDTQLLDQIQRPQLLDPSRSKEFFRAKQVFQAKENQGSSDTFTDFAGEQVQKLFDCIDSLFKLNQRFSDLPSYGDSFKAAYIILGRFLKAIIGKGENYHKAVENLTGRKWLDYRKIYPEIFPEFKFNDNEQAIAEKILGANDTINDLLERYKLCLQDMSDPARSKGFYYPKIFDLDRLGISEADYYARVNTVNFFKEDNVKRAIERFNDTYQELVADYKEAKITFKDILFKLMDAFGSVFYNIESKLPFEFRTTALSNKANSLLLKMDSFIGSIKDLMEDCRQDSLHVNAGSFRKLGDSYRKLNLMAVKKGQWDEFIEKLRGLFDNSEFWTELKELFEEILRPGETYARLGVLGKIQSQILQINK